MARLQDVERDDFDRVDIGYMLAAHRPPSDWYMYI